jgi:hypothetical protein
VLGDRLSQEPRLPFRFVPSGKTFQLNYFDIGKELN